MVIGFDARPLNPKVRHWGVGVVIDAVLSRLNGPFKFQGIAQSFPGAKEQGIVTWPWIPRMNDLLFEFSPLRAKHVDVYWGSNHLVPAMCRTPSVVTVHDLLLIKYPHDQPHSRLLARRLAASVRKASTVVTDSKTTADDLIAAFPEVARKVEVGLLGFSEERNSSETRLNPGRLPEQQEPYVLMLGAHRPRKNLTLAVQAVTELHQRGTPLQLLVTGQVHAAFRTTSKRSNRQVRCVGVVPRTRISELLRGAVALAFPSEYEGFGFPMLEAMAADCPVLALDTPINREIAGKAAWLLPANAAQWADAMARLLSDTSIRKDFIQRGRQNLSRFSWKRTAEIYAEAFRRAGTH